MALGSANARVTIVAYFSLTCPHCAGFEENVLPLLRTNYIDNGKVRFVAREFPLDAKAIAGAMLLRCIAAGNSNHISGARRHVAWECGARSPSHHPPIGL